MGCPLPQEEVAAWVPSAGTQVVDGALVLDGFSEGAVVGNQFVLGETPVVMLIWEIEQLGSEPLSFGIWFVAPEDGIFYRTDGFVVIAGEEHQTLPAQEGDTLQLFISAQEGRIAFVLNGAVL